MLQAADQLLEKFIREHYSENIEEGEEITEGWDGKAWTMPVKDFVEVMKKDKYGSKLIQKELDDWDELGGWEEEASKKADRYEQVGDPSQETLEAEKWLLSDENLRREVLNVIDGYDTVDSMAGALEEIFDVYDVLDEKERAKVDWRQLAMNVLDWDEIKEASKKTAQRIDEEKRQLEDTIRSRESQIDKKQPGFAKKLLDKVRKALDFSELRNVWDEVKALPAFARKQSDKNVKYLRLTNPEIKALSWIAYNVEPGITAVADSVNAEGVAEVSESMLPPLKRAIRKKLQSGRQRHDPFKKRDLQTLLDKVEALSKMKDRNYVASNYEWLLVKFGRKTFNALLADTDEKKTAGLEIIEKLEEDQGMFFPFKEHNHVTFHMGSVRFPIDILFLMENSIGELKVAKIIHNAQPGADENWSHPKTKHVLELAGGTCKKYNIKVGSTCEIK
jgi:uncharacterized membrane protein (UPF0127 family)